VAIACVDPEIRPRRLLLVASTTAVAVGAAGTFGDVALRSAVLGTTFSAVDPRSVVTAPVTAAAAVVAEVAADAVAESIDAWFDAPERAAARVAAWMVWIAS
jgi:hypothetical protein